MANQQYVYIQCRNGVLSIKKNFSTILSCDFIPMDQVKILGDIKISMILNVWYIDYDNIISKSDQTCDKMSNTNVNKTDECSKENNVIRQIVENFYVKLHNIFKNDTNISLFLLYVAKLLMFDEKGINQKIHIVTFDDDNQVIKDLIELLIPSFFENLGVYDHIFMFENESWKINKNLSLMMNNNLFSKTKIQVLGSSCVLSRDQISDTYFMKIHSEKILSKTTKLDSSILLWLITKNINTVKITKGIKKKHNDEISRFLIALN